MEEDATSVYQDILISQVQDVKVACLVTVTYFLLNIMAFSLACTCYAPGSVGLSCNQTTGQCQCTEGAEDLKCDVCKDFYFNVTAGCLGTNEFCCPVLIQYSLISPYAL